MAVREGGESFLQSIYPNGLVVLGGMGVDISNDILAGTVAGLGGAGTLSDVGGAERLARVLQDGDPTGNTRLSLTEFPNQHMVAYVLDKYFQEGGTRAHGRRMRYRPVPKYRLENKVVHGEGLEVPEAEMLTVLDAFSQVVTARRIAHRVAAAQGIEPGPIGVNGLGKVPIPMAAALLGIVLAGADYTTRGAGVKPDVPGVIRALHAGNRVEYPIQVDFARVYAHAAKTPFVQHSIAVDPGPYGGTPRSHPEFWAIAGTVDGAKRYVDNGANVIVHESRVAGGHNIPSAMNEATPEQMIDQVPAPIVVAGGVLLRGGLRHWVSQGAAGIQIGSLFAVCRESGMAPREKQEVVKAALRGTLNVEDNQGISPTGYPFQTARISGTITDPTAASSMSRSCTVSALETPYVDVQSGELGYRCPADVVEHIQNRFPEGGSEARIRAAGCLCRMLFASSGKGQENIITGQRDISVVTMGSTASELIHALVVEHRLPITAAKVLQFVQ